MVEYWKDPRVRARRSVQAKIRERMRQLERFARHDMQHTDRFKVVAGKLAALNEQLEQLK
jgi:hypothetical protein